MSEAKRDGNWVASALGVSSSDGVTTLPLLVDPITGRLLTDSASGSGDVVGPASSTDEAVARFDGLTGRLLQNSVVLISDTGDVTGVASIVSSGAITTKTSIVLEDPGAGTFTVTLQAPTLAGSYTLTLPTTDGANGEYLQTDGNGVLTWAAVSGSGANTALSNLASVAINTSLLPGANDGAALGSGTLSFSDLFLASGALINFANGNSVITHSSGILTVSTGDLRVSSAGTNTASVVTVGGSQTLTNKQLTAATVNTSFTPTASDGSALGSATLMFADLFLASGAVINFNNGDTTLTHATGIITCAISNASTTPQFSYTQASTGDASNRFALGSTISYAIGIDNSVAGDPFKISTAASASAVLGTGDLLTLTSAGAVTLASSLTATSILATANDSGALGASGTAWADLFLASGGVINWNAGNATITHSAGLLTFNTAITLGTSNSLTCGTIELGHASANTLSASGGVLSIEGVAIPTISSTSTLTNKIISHTIEPGTDDTYTGENATGFNATATIAQWDAVYLSTTGWALTDADAASTAGGVMVALAAAAGTNGNPLTVVLRGIVRNDGWTWATVGAPLYLDTATPGGLTLTAPSGTDDVVRIVGYVLSDDCIYFNPSNDWITRT